MTNTASPAGQAESPTLSEGVQRGNIMRRTVAQALAGANSVVVYATGAIIGHMLAPDKTLATLPISIFVVGMAASILPAGAIARRYGRRMAFLAGAGCGVMVGVLAALAVMIGSFWLFCLATFFGGAYAAVVLSFRFAAADGVSPAMRPRALSFVMGGGVVAGIVGPQLVTYTMNLWPAHMFAATFIAQAAVAAVSALVLFGVKLHRPTAAELAGGRPLGAIVRQPLFVTAVICGAVSYMLMNFLMTAAPLAMQMCGHSQESSNLGLQWHVIAMYVPSFFTGRLITRFGAGRVVTAGLVLTGAAAAVGLTGLDVAHFWLTLILLGIGWNFGFVGASALVLECHRPEEKTRVQSFNDFIIFGTMAMGSFASGGLLAAYDWDMVLWVSFVPLALAVAVLAATAASNRRAPALQSAVDAPAVTSLQGAIIKLSHLPVALFICYLLSIGSALAAQDTGPEAINGDARSEAPASGAGLFQSAGGDLQARAWAYSCATCHGAGHSPTAGIPTLAGMPTEDIVKAMLAYASGERPGLLKSQIALGYDEAVLRRIGKWYENLPRSRQGQP